METTDKLVPRTYDISSYWRVDEGISQEHHNLLETITNKVNEKYVEMGGITAVKYCDLPNILDYILEEKLQDNSVLEEMVKRIEKDKEENPKDYK